MITLRTAQYVEGLKAQAAYDFLATFDQDEYRAWMPGEHLHYISHRRTPDYVGSTYYLDQLIGGIRVKATETIIEATPYTRLRRQVLWFGVRSPVRMLFEFVDDDRGVMITHTVTAGFTGWRRILDPVFRLFFFTKRFDAALDQHMQDEILALREFIPGRARRRA